MYHKYLRELNKSLLLSSIRYKAVNNTPIQISGSVQTSLCLEQIPAVVLQIKLPVLQDNALATELIIGRDFLNFHKISATFNPHIDQDAMQLFPCSLLQLVAGNESQNLRELQIAEIITDFDREITDRVRDLLIEIENLLIPAVENGYCVKLNLKDDSPYAYAPRKLAWAERIQIRQIIEDLLERDIIRPSVSPFCARIVPVKKKNGSMRLCVDLRPLNDKIIKQNYPFPIIKDCIA